MHNLHSLPAPLLVAPEDLSNAPSGTDKPASASEKAQEGLPVDQIKKRVGSVISLDMGGPSGWGGC